PQSKQMWIKKSVHSPLFTGFTYFFRRLSRKNPAVTAGTAFAGRKSHCYVLQTKHKSTRAGKAAPPAPRPCGAELPVRALFSFVLLGYLQGMSFLFRGLPSTNTEHAVQFPVPPGSKQARPRTVV